MKKTLGIFVLVFFTGLPTGLTAETSIDVKSLIQQAVECNPGLRVKKATYEAQRARVIDNWLPEDPRIGADVEGQPSLFDFNNRTNYEYMAEQDIPFPTKLFFRGVSAARQADVAYQDYKEEERQLIWHVEQPYYELQTARRTLQYLDEQKVLLEQLTKSVKARYEANQAAQTDILKVQIEGSKLAIETFDWKQKEHLAQAHFSHLLNKPLDALYPTVIEEARPVLRLDLPDLEAMALKSRPELKALQFGIERAKAERALEQTKWLPDVILRIEARQYKPESSIREYDTFLGVSVPVWSLIKGVGGTWRAAESDVQAAEALYLKMKNEVLLSVHEAYSKLKSAENAVDTYENQILPQAHQQVEVALSSYEAGRVDFLSVVDAERTLKSTQIEIAEALSRYELALSDLRLSVGEDLVR